MSTIANERGLVPQIALVTGVEGGTPVPVSSANPIPMGFVAAAYVDRTVASLSAGQAAGTSVVLAANPARRGLMINPPIDCTLLISAASGTPRGWPLFANVPNTIVGQECPTNDIYIYGLTAGQVLAIWEA